MNQAPGGLLIVLQLDEEGAVLAECSPICLSKCFTDYFCVPLAATGMVDSGGRRELTQRYPTFYT